MCDKVRNMNVWLTSGEKVFERLFSILTKT